MSALAIQKNWIAEEIELFLYHMGIQYLWFHAIIFLIMVSEKNLLPASVKWQTSLKY